MGIDLFIVMMMNRSILQVESDNKTGMWLSGQYLLIDIMYIYKM